MNTVAQTLVLLWVAGWTIAMGWAAWRHRAVSVTRLGGARLPEKAAGFPGD